MVTKKKAKSSAIENKDKSKIQVTNTDKTSVIKIDSSMYPLDAIYHTVYTFTNNAFISLDDDTDGIIQITLEWKDNKKIKDIESIFQEELLNQVIKGSIFFNNKKDIELIVSNALVTSNIND